ncbi:MAG: hypothetical protein JJ916_13135 [Phycisphaerales bacterium]|nr:hypothetical protein [Phycisphaerales bacterium]
MKERDQKILLECIELIRRVQNFPPSTVNRSKSLGEIYSFADVVGDAAKIIDFYKLTYIEHLEYLPARQLGTLRDAARETLQYFDAILGFDPTQVSNPNDEYAAHKSNLVSNYQKTFTSLYSLIGFLSIDANRVPKIESSFHKAIDEIRLEVDAVKHENVMRAEQFMEEADSLMKSLEGSKVQAEKALDVIQGVAAESGVSAQAGYFESEAERAEDSASKWFWATAVFSLILVAAAVILLITSSHEFFRVDSVYASIQLVAGKALIYATLTSLVLFSSRNYNTCKHNATINRHRFNSLRTYTALVEAAGDSANRDIVLTHAAECIFSDQPTGYNKQDTSEIRSSTLMSISPPVIKSGSDT